MEDKMATQQNPFEKLLNIPIDPEVAKSIAKGIEQRQKTREILYTKIEISHGKFNLDRGYVSWNQNSKKPVF